MTKSVVAYAKETVYGESPNTSYCLRSGDVSEFSLLKAVSREVAPIKAKKTGLLRVMFELNGETHCYTIEGDYPTNEQEAEQLARAIYKVTAEGLSK